MHKLRLGRGYFTLRCLKRCLRCIDVRLRGQILALGIVDFLLCYQPFFRPGDFREPRILHVTVDITLRFSPRHLVLRPRNFVVARFDGGFVLL